MLDFLMIFKRAAGNAGIIEIYPKFIIKKVTTS